MLYPFLKILMQIAMRLYFRRIDLSGLKHVDNSRPALILANHTNGFMDAMIAGAALRRRVSFFTRGDVFRHKWAGRLMRAAGMLPVYRMQDGKDQLALNESSNQAALRTLDRGGAVLIFAEGASNGLKMVRPLKKGPFRLAVQAAAASDRTPELLPLGINYVLPEAPFTDVYVQAGPAIAIDALDLSTETDRNRMALQLMRRTADMLPYLAWHADGPATAALIQDLLVVQQAGRPSFSATLELAQQVRALPAEEQDRLRAAIDGYRLLEAELGLLPDHVPGKYPLWDRIIALLAALPSAAGWLFHLAPVKISRAITRSRVKERDMSSSVFLALCVGLTLAWYIVWLTAALLLLPTEIAAVMLPALALCGVIYLKLFRPAAQRIRGRWRERRAQRRQPDRWAAFAMLRQELLQQTIPE